MLTTSDPARTVTSVLVTEDDDGARSLIGTALSRAGFQVSSAATGFEARAALDASPVHLLLLDLGLPDVDGLDLLAEIRHDNPVPTIVVSGRTSEADRVLALESGADDYLVKPCSPRELVARARALLRRARGEAGRSTPEEIAFADLAIDIGARELRRRGEIVEVRRKEFDLLVFLAQHPRRVFSRGDLLRRVWDSAPEYQTDATVTEHVRRLRRVIEHDAARPRHLVTVARAGYRLDP
ncbi:MAG: response regulator transcription factor [Actinobacteria bacterium]|nr:response regulator transcription factor [Actinomycetota bacterium]